jgi:excinuclease UvrABC ATPase subunit
VRTMQYSNSVESRSKFTSLAHMSHIKSFGDLGGACDECCIIGKYAQCDLNRILSAQVVLAATVTIMMTSMTTMLVVKPGK